MKGDPAGGKPARKSAQKTGAKADPNVNLRARSRADVDRVFHALGDPSRRTILERLTAGPVSVSQLAPPLRMTLAAVVQHLQVLEASGLVRTEKTGRVRTCRLESSGFSVADRWIKERRTVWEKRLDQLGEMLAEDADNG